MLSPIRRVIITKYVYLKKYGKGGTAFSLTKRIAKKLGYTLDKNNSNSFIMRVIREYEQS